jgi:DNA segregation ATPase FtsK/SpoIIIE, S-DNA-T family
MPSSFKRQVMGQPLAQVDNPDPFAVPVWRSPVYQTPHAIIWTVQLVRLIWRLLWFALRHPLLAGGCALLVFTWFKLGWLGLAALAAFIAIDGALAYLLWPEWFARHVVQAARNRWRHWFYRRRWQAAMTLSGLAPSYRGRVMVPVFAGVHTAGAVDLVTVRLVTGQAPDAFADRTTNLAHAFGAQLCRIRDARPGVVTLEFVRSDTLADPIPALPIDPLARFDALPVGRCEDGSPWLLRLLGSHVLIAGGDRLGQGLGDLVRCPGDAARDPRRMGAGMGAGPQANGAVLRPRPVHPLRRRGGGHGAAPRGRRDRDARPGIPVRGNYADVHSLDCVPVLGRARRRARVPDRLPA